MLTALTTAFASLSIFSMGVVAATAIRVSLRNSATWENTTGRDRRFCEPSALNIPGVGDIAP